MPDRSATAHLIAIKDIVARHDPDSSWFEPIISDGRNRVMLISGPPGTPPDPHLHPDYNEWWISAGGTTQWQIGQYEPLLATFGDVVIAPAGYSHDIRPKGTGAALRIAVSHPNSNHDIRGVAPCRNVPIEYEMPTPNLIHTRLDSTIQRNGTDNEWSQIVIKDHRNLATIIQDLPGSESPAAREPAGDEWFLMLRGTATLHTQGDASLDLDVEAGDIVLAEGGTRYRITTVGATPSVRILVSAPF